MASFRHSQKEGTAGGRIDLDKLGGGGKIPGQGAVEAPGEVPWDVSARRLLRMKTRTLGRTGLEVGVIGLGTEYLNGTPSKTYTSVVHRAVDAGVDYIDIVYSFPEYLDNLGAALKGKGARFSSPDTWVRRKPTVSTADRATSPSAKASSTTFLPGCVPTTSTSLSSPTATRRMTSGG